MVFSSLIFLYLFLPACLIAYYCVRNTQAKNLILVLFSVAFYAWGEPFYVLLLLASGLFNYAMGRWIGRFGKESVRRKLLLILSAAVNLGALIVFKYAGLLVDSINQLAGASWPVPQIRLPIGISFYTFQAMSYVVDVYRGQVQVQKSYGKFLLYLALFPQLIAGPIVRYADIEAQIDERHASREDVFYGLLRFSMGLGKKILIADHAYKTVTQLLDGALSTVLGTWLGVILFAFQLYFDFSGYSDMAIGLGRIFGFRYQENFNLPYMARSITDFWRRWHISLSTFFRDYVYIPLGGNRRHRWLNLLITWGLTGLWHGASWNFLLWGLYFFVLLELEKLSEPVLQRLPRTLRHTMTMLLVLLGWTVFYFTDFSRLGEAFRVMFGVGGVRFLTEQVRIQLINNLPLLVLCVLGASPIPRAMGDWLGLLCAEQEPGGRKQKVYVLVCYVFCAALLLLSTISLVGSGFSAFLYYRF